MAPASEKKFPLSAEDYELYEEVGEGVSANVYRALCVPLDQIVAIKILDLEKCNSDLDRIRREVQTMVLVDHPNLLRAHCSFASGHNLWVVMPYMAGGSCLHIMKTAYPEGLEEPIIATLLHEVLKALVYLHAHGHIHRDVKAGNILIDTNGDVKLADFGVAACMYDTGDRQRSRNTFVGTPCWMAPEVMQQLHGYDFRADIWSFGITALELAHGHAPFSKYPPMKVLLMTLQNAPPGLDYERDKRFSKSFREMIAACLVKDPKKRPPAEKLLKHSFFKHARRNDYLVRTILEGLPPLGERFRILKAKEADILAQNNAFHEDREHLSQQEYIRGISAWEFNLEDLKNQAALIQDDLTSNSEDSIVSGKHLDGQDETERGNLKKSNHSEAAPGLEDELNGAYNLDNSFAGFPMKPLRALKNCFDVDYDDIGMGSPLSVDPEEQGKMKLLTGDAMDQEEGQNDRSDSGHNGSTSHIVGLTKLPGGLLQQDNAVSPRKFVSNGDREYLQPISETQQNYSGPLQLRQKKDFSASIPDLNLGEDGSESAVVERRGRFKVTSAELGSKSPKSSLLSSSGNSTSAMLPRVSTATVLPALQSILQHNLTQRDEILRLMKFVEPISGNCSEFTEGATNGIPQVNPTSIRERELEAQMNQMQKRVGSLVEELQRTKARNAELERSLNEALQKNDDTLQ